MAPSESLAAAVPDGSQGVPPVRGATDDGVEPNGHGLEGSFDRQALLYALQAMRLGDFSVRLPGDQTGLSGKIADTFNEIVAANERMAHQLEHVGQVVGREGKTRQRVRFGLSAGAWGEMEISVNTLIDDLLWPTAAVTHAIAAVAQGDLLQTVRLDVDGRPLEGRVPALGQYRQHDDQAAERVHVRGDPRRARGRHRRQARRAGAGPRGQRRLEGPDRERQLDGEQPDGAGPQHRRGHDRGRQRRSVEKDHGRRARRDPAAEGSHQHDGRPAALVRLGSDARRARGRHRGQARRPGPGPRCRRHLEGFDRLGQCDVRQSDRSGAQHRECDDRGRARRSVAQDHRRCPRRDPRAEGHDQHDGRSAQRLRLRGDARRPRGRHRGPARRPGAGARGGRHLEGPDRQRQFHGRQSDRAGPQHRRGLDRDRPRRSVEEDHGQCQRRDPAAEGDHQHDGRPAERLCRRGNARRPRGRHRRPPRRPGQCARRRRHLEGSDRERQLDGGQSDRPGAQHRRGGDGDRQWRSVEEDHGQRQRRDPAAEGHHQHDGRSAQRLRRRGDARRPRGRHRRASSAARRR